MKSYLVAFSTVVVLSSMTAFGQAPDAEKLLLPIAPQRVVGAFGSEWVTSATITNMSDSPVLVTRDVGGCVVLCISQPLPARSTALASSIPHSNVVLGNFLFVERNRVKDLAVTLRTRDVSRQHETWGTVIPVVGEADLFDRPFGLVDVPMESQFRATLRIYDFNAETPAAVRVRVYEFDPKRDPADQRPDADKLLLDITPEFTLDHPGFGRLYPGSIEFPLSTRPELAGARRVRVQIDPLNSIRDYWAFVSVTHNTTQHVTIISPH